MHQKPGTLITYILSVVVLIILCLPLSTFSAALSMEYSLGFNGHFQLETWTPLTIILENRGRATSGRLEVLVTSGSEYLGNVYQTTYSLDVELPYNSTKLCSFTILINSFTHGLIIRFKQAEETLLSESINLRPSYTTKRFALVVDDKTSPDFLSVLPQHLFSVNVRPRFLPETWYGYDSVKIIIITAEMLKRLRERQFQALTQWIKWGGYLVTAGGVNYGSLLDQRTKTLLPIHILGHRQFSELTSLEDFCGQKLSGSDAFLVVRANIQDSDVLLQEDDVPLIIQKTLGLGQMLFLAFDFQTPPFSRWANRKMFWDKMLSVQPVIDDSSIDVNNQEILDSLLSNMPVGFPNVKIVFFSIGAYIVLLRFFLKKIEKYRETRWKNVGCLLLVITVFSITSYAAFLYPRDRKSLTYSSFFLMNVASQSKIASGKYIFGLYSIKETDYNVSFGSRSHPMSYLVTKDANKKTPHTYRLHEDTSGQHIIGFSENWSYSFFLLHTKLEFPILGEAHFDNQGLRISIDNMTPHKIRDCRIYFEKRVFFLGNILPNKKQIKNIPRSVMQHKELFDNQETDLMSNNEIPGVSSFVKALQKDFTKDILLAVHSVHQSQEESLQFIGWIDTGIVKTEFSRPGITGDDLTLLTWKIPVSQ